MGISSIPRVRLDREVSIQISGYPVFAAATDTLVFSLCISVWAGGASLLILGLSIPQIVGVMIIARVLIVAFVVANGWMGGEWHIGFTIAQRYVNTVLPAAPRIALIFNRLPD